MAKYRIELVRDVRYRVQIDIEAESDDEARELARGYSYNLDLAWVREGGIFSDVTDIYKWNPTEDESVYPGGTSVPLN